MCMELWKLNAILVWLNIYASALLAAPDGMPTVWVGHHQGHMGMERVAGPDLMIEVIKRNDSVSTLIFFVVVRMALPKNYVTS